VIAFSWRQFRTQALIGAAGLVILGVILLVTGPNLVHIYDAAVAQCRASGGGGNCNNPVANDDGKLQVLALGLVLAVPVVIGMFWGAPLVARELETGTFRLAWTQSVSRLRWILVKLGLVGLASAFVAGLLSLMVTWWFSPIDDVTANRFGAASFGMHGFVPAGYALFAFALGAMTGLLFRRTLPAMAVTLVGFVVTRLVVADWVRPHFMKPITEALKLNANANQSWGFINSGSGAVSVTTGPPSLPNAFIVSNNIVNNQGQSPTNSFITKACPNLGSGGQQSFQRCVSAISAHYHQVVVYQPANRFWAFQTYETLLFVVLAALFAGVSVWWVRHRVS
jgi:ABC-type transport system involved in multi-copper enzyme maturation permease subunit